MPKGTFCLHYINMSRREFYKIILNNDNIQDGLSMKFIQHICTKLM